MKIVCLFLFGLVMTASQFRRRQGGTIYLPLRLSKCRGWAHGRRQLFCPLPKGVRPPREYNSHPLFSGSAVILLNTRYNSNRDGSFSLPSPRSQVPTATTV